MPLTEQELRHHLEAAADQALPPRFTAADLAGRIRRRRARTAVAVSAGLAAVAAAVATPVALAYHAPSGIILPGRAGPSLPPGAKLGPGTNPGRESAPAPSLRQLQFQVTVNGHGHTAGPIVVQKPPKGCGRSPADPCPGNLGSGFFVRPGELLRIRVLVTVPRRARVTDLWLGISHGTFGSNRSGPIGQQPVLAHIRSGLEPGRHTYRIAWTVPDETRTGTVLWLAGSWTGMLPLAGSAGSHEPLVSASISAPITVFVAR
jgi:hypothetical protein